MKSVKSILIFRYKVTYMSGQVIEFWADELEAVTKDFPYCKWDRRLTIEHAPPEYHYPAPNYINFGAIESFWVTEQKSLLVPIK